MFDTDPYRLNKIISCRLSDVLSEKLVRQVIRHWQKLPPGVESSSGLKNLWEEACVHIRSESSLSDLYRDELLKTMSGKVDKLSLLELAALWLQTHGGESYAVGPENEPEEVDIERTGDFAKQPFPSKKIEEWPIDRNAIAKHVVAEALMYECWNYENLRIRTWLGV